MSHQEPKGCGAFENAGIDKCGVDGHLCAKCWSDYYAPRAERLTGADTRDQTIRDQAARIAELETQLKEARELARCGGWTK